MKKRLLTLTLLLAAIVSSVGAQTQISSAAEFRSYVTDGSTGNFKLTADINLGTWTPRTFKGLFDGNGHTITIKVSGADNLGLFSVLSGATVTNLTVKGTVTAEYYNAGGIAGKMDTKSVIKNCKSYVDVTLKASNGENGGGIVGSCYEGSTIEKCRAYGTITTHTGLYHTAGGIAGQIQKGSGEACTMKDCYFGGIVAGPTNYVGMITGKKDSESTIKNCTYSSQNANGFKAIGTPQGSQDDSANGVVATNVEPTNDENNESSDTDTPEAIDTWSRLYVAISRNKTAIQLTANVKYGEGEGAHAKKALPAIAADKEVTIYLSGHTIDGDGSVRIFDNQGTLTIMGDDGKIINGYSTDKGGAIVNTGTLRLSQGIVFTGNKAPKGGAIWQGGTLEVTGEVTIKDNSETSGSRLNNVYLPTDKVISVTGNIKNSVIGVTMENGTGVFTSGLGAHMTDTNMGDDAVRQIFPADNDTYVTSYNGQEGAIVSYDEHVYTVTSESGLIDAIKDANIENIIVTEEITSKFSLPDIAASREVTIDLNGFDLSNVTVTNYGKLTLKNSSSTQAHFGRIVNQDGGVLTLNDTFAIHDNKDFSNGGGIYNNGQLWMMGNISLFGDMAGGSGIYNDERGTINVMGKLDLNWASKETRIYQGGTFNIYGQINCKQRSVVYIPRNHYIHVYTDLSDSYIRISRDEKGNTFTKGLGKNSPALLQLGKLNKVFFFGTGERTSDQAFVIKDGEVTNLTCYDDIRDIRDMNALVEEASTKTLSQYMIRLGYDIINYDNWNLKSEFSKTVYIDLNGCNIQNPYIINTGNLTIYNSGMADGTHGVLQKNIQNRKDGGAIMNSGTLTICDGVTFADNKAWNSGGAIYNKAQLNIEGNVTFTGNTAGNGGAIYNDVDGIVNASGNVIFAGNTATNSGSGNNIYHAGKSFTFAGTTSGTQEGDVFLGNGKTIQFRSGNADVIVSKSDDIKVTGEGAMVNYESADDVPWRFAASTAKSLTFTAGPTSVGGNSFKDFKVLEEITLPSTMSNVASTAFVGCDKVTRLIFNLKNPSNLTWDNYEDSFWEEGADMSVYVDKNYLADWKAKFPYWFFEDVSSLNLGEEEDPENGTTTGIRTVETQSNGPAVSDVWYTIGGQRLNGQPTKPGLYINNGKKVVIK
ncbi:MAG: leucine-rich repeat protein [Prevotella sp.]|nr:leucine-rich repeat protein [Prevotella sp.]